METEMFNKMYEVNTKKKDLYLKVKILRVWIESFVAFGPTICLLLCDEYGVRIEASVGSEYFDRYEFLLSAEKLWFTLKNFTVRFAAILGDLTPHVYQIHIDSETVMKIINWPNDNHYLVFHPIQRIINGSVYRRHPIDVFGVITWVGPLDSVESSSSSVIYSTRRIKVQFTIRDKDHRGLECLVYGESAEDLVQRFENDKYKHLFCVLRCFCIQTFMGKSWLYSKEGLSKIQYNPYEFPEVLEFFRSFEINHNLSYSDDHKKGYNIF